MLTPTFNSTYTVSVELTIHDEQTFRQAAQQKALEEGCGEDSTAYGPGGSMSLGECAMMLIDPGISPPGCTIQQSWAI